MIRYRDINLVLCYPFLEVAGGTQDYKVDKLTEFIYYCKSLRQVLDLAESNDCDKSYCANRWYNFICSKACEEMFCEYGAKAETNIKDKFTDVYINNIPFDIKLTVLPKNFKSENLNSRQGKNEFCKILYQNQLNERRYLSNKIYVVVDKGDYLSSLRGKSDFKAIEEKVKSFMQYYTNKEIPIVKVDGKEFYADLIVVK